MDSGLEQLDFLEQRVGLLLEKYRGMSEKNTELEEKLGSQQQRVQQLEEMLKNKDSLLADVGSRVERLLQKFTDINPPVPDTPLLPADESR